MTKKTTTLGSIVRGIRARNGWTLSEMSQHAGIPVSTLSKVEHDRLTLSYDKLQQLSQRLNMSVSDLFDEQATPTENVVTGRRSIGTIDNALRVTTPNYDYYYLCTELRKKRMVPILIQVRAKTLREFGSLVSHAGEEVIYVIEGRVEVHTEYYDSVVISEGELIYIDSNMGHAYTLAEGCEKATVLGVCSSLEDDLQETLLTQAHTSWSEPNHRAPMRKSAKRAENAEQAK